MSAASGAAVSRLPPVRGIATISAVVSSAPTGMMPHPCQGRTGGWVSGIVSVRATRTGTALGQSTLQPPALPTRCRFAIEAQTVPTHTPSVVGGTGEAARGLGQLLWLSRCACVHVDIRSGEQGDGPCSAGG
uniref:Uncharacterized protein n=1 Tax=Eutreptiella gymnastica TaxID=73025 RepID=A0A7S1IRM6_9EUGL|mmetsp:Transcript_36684/g.65612  ORF Transcript_36684/g.65612 Transcript_36684/m.65612 type:complete len:132 (+) Transcript_36684:5-400(+)